MKLTPATALEVKRRFWNGDSQAAIATAVGVSQSSVSDVCTGRSFSFIPWPDGSFTPPSSRERRGRKAGFMEREEAALDRIADATQGPTERGADPFLSSPLGPIDMREKIEEAGEEAAAVAEWRRSLADMVEQVKETADLALDDDIKRIVSSFNSEEFVQNLNAVPVPPKGETIEWDHIIAVAGKRNRYVEMARLDEGVRTALCIVYKALPPNDWNEAFVYPLLVRTMDMLGISFMEKEKEDVGENP